jgi:hypothetical protein
MPYLCFRRYVTDNEAVRASGKPAVREKSHILQGNNLVSILVNHFANEGLSAEATRAQHQKHVSQPSKWRYVPDRRCAHL